MAKLKKWADLIYEAQYVKAHTVKVNSKELNPLTLCMKDDALGTKGCILS